jgi:hypothetical protein
MTRTRVSNWLAALGFAVVLAFASAQSGSARAAQAKAGKADKDIYVCSCGKTKSCPCMTMSNKEGKCPCGDDMKKVAADSAWAKHNRRALE